MEALSGSTSFVSDSDSETCLLLVFFPKDENLGVLKSIVCVRVWVGGRCGSECGGGKGREVGGGVGGGDLGGARPRF